MGYFSFNSFNKFLLVIFFTSFLAACGGGGGSGAKRTSTSCSNEDPYCNSKYEELRIKTASDRIWLSVTGELHWLQATPEGRLRGETEFEEVSTKTLEFWSSTDPSVVTVNIDGLIEAVGVGEAEIIYEIEISEGVRQPARIRVIVKESADNISPEANAGSNIKADMHEEVTLDASRSFDRDGTISSYEWKEGDIILSTDVSFTKDNYTVGVHKITLTVTDNLGATGTDTVDVIINNNAPVANAGSDLTYNFGEEVTLDASGSTDSDGIIVSYQWSGGGIDRDEKKFTTLKLSPGVHTLTLIVVDDAGATDTDTVIITINALPVGNAGEDQTKKLGESVTLVASSDDEDIESYQWKEGDIILSTEASFTKDDFSAGVHRITLTVTDKNGATDTDTVVIVIINNPPDADAGADQTKNQSEEVTLDASGSTDSDGTIKRYQWSENGIDLGEGSQILLSDLSVGQHTITLTVTDDNDATDTDIVIVTITNISPVANAGTDKTENQSKEIILNASGSIDSDGTIDRYQWSESGVSLGEGEEITLSDLSVGEHLITLTITDNNGATDIDTVVITITNASPVADAGENQTRNQEQDVTLNASGSTDSDGTIDSYQWRENGVLLGDGKEIIISDLSVGQHTITLTVTDNNGAADTDTIILTIDNDLPNANAGVDQTKNQGEEVVLNASGSIDSDGTIEYYKWSENGINLGEESEITISHLSVGQHTITLTVTDNNGGKVTDTTVITIINIPPVADAGTDQTKNQGEEVTFNASGSSDYGAIESYQWKEGETTLSTAASFNKDDFTVGEHTITLTVTDDNGATDTDTIVITITNVAPSADAGADQAKNQGEIVIISADGSFDYGTIESYQWKEEGGSILSAAASFNKDDFTVGEHTITLTVTDDNGATDTDTIVITITNVAPSADAGEDQVKNQGEEVTLDASASNDYGTIETYQWKDEQGNILSTAATFTKDNFTSGTHTITLTVTDNDGATASDNVIVTIVQQIPLNDTGITLCADDVDDEFECSLLDFPGQDADYGRDALAEVGELEKVGAGVAGFDYTRICNNGEEEGEGNCLNPVLGSGANNWACTRDNVTGLIWEVKTDDGGIRDRDNLYTWYNSDSTNNGGNAGTENGGNCSDAGYCDTEKYSERVNIAGLCGFNDWRMPSRFELLSIVNYGSHDPSNPAIDTEYFPNTNIENAKYWTGSPDSNKNTIAWEISFSDDNGGLNSVKEVGQYVRLVRYGSN